MTIITYSVKNNSEAHKMLSRYVDTISSINKIRMILSHSYRVEIVNKLKLEIDNIKQELNLDCDILDVKFDCQKWRFLGFRLGKPMNCKNFKIIYSD